MSNTEVPADFRFHPSPLARYPGGGAVSGTPATRSMGEYERQDFYHYLPVNDAAISWGAYLTGVGRACTGPNQEYPPKGHPGLYDHSWSRGRVLPEFQILLISEGRGIFESKETGTVSVGPGYTFILFPGVWHRYRPDADVGWCERWISFNGVMTHRLQELEVIDPSRAVHRARDFDRLIEGFDQLLSRVRSSPNQNSVMLSMQVLSLIGNIIESMVDPGQIPGGDRTVRENTIGDPLVADTLNLIWTHSDRAFTVKSFADRLCVSKRVLQRRFHAAVGHSVLQEMIACRLSRAKRLLKETDLGIKEVAYIAGFPSEERMRVTFNRTEKVSPSQYRAAAMAEKHGGTSK